VYFDDARRAGLQKKRALAADPEKVKIREEAELKRQKKMTEFACVEVAATLVAKEQCCKQNCLKV
jgi:hypothetical protein